MCSGNFPAASSRPTCTRVQGRPRAFRSAKVKSRRPVFLPATSGRAVMKILAHSCCARTYTIGRPSGSLIIQVNYSGRYAISMISGVVPSALMNYQGRSAVPIPDVFDGPFGQVLAHSIERGGDDGTGRRVVPPPREMTPGGLEAGILNEHRDGAGNP